MPMQKYNKSEGKLDVLTGRQAHVLNSHFQRTGKTDLGAFSEDERKAFDADLASARKQDEAEQKELFAAQDKAADEGMHDKSDEK